MKVAILGVRGLGAEIAKNLVLLGPAAIGLFDSSLVEVKDLGSNCFLRPSDVGRLTRAEATIRMVRKLNPTVSLQLLPSSDPSHLSDFQVIILTDSDEATIELIDDYCRSSHKGFISVASSGPAGCLFIDFGPEFQILNRNGQEPLVLLIHEIRGNEVWFLDDQVMDLREGDHLRLDNVVGLDVNGKEWVVEEIISAQSVVLEGLDNAAGEYIKGGTATEVKYPEKVNFESWKLCKSEPFQYALRENEDKTKFARAAYCQDIRQKSGKTRQLHLAFLALQRFQKIHGRHPTPLSDEEAQECVSLSESINSEYSTVEELNPEYTLLLCKYAAFQPIPFATFWGGIVAQEVIKYTGSFRPMEQMMCYEWFDIVRKESDRKVVEDRYWDQTGVMGETVTRRMKEMNVFLVGAGALGCEYLKAFALMGVCCGSGSLEVTDDDHIELSNLTRQFLFQREHIGRAKSEVASDAAREMNPDLRVTARQERVTPHTQHIYPDQFWSKLDLVLSAVDNVSARLYLDQQCLWHSKPFFESGTKGLSGSSMVILPYQTKSYSDLELGDDKQAVANCTLKRFPHLPEHCIEWARGMFFSYFSEGPGEAMKFLENKQEYLRNISETLHLHDQRIRLEEIHTFLRCVSNPSFSFCVQLARDIFQTHFHNEIRQLLHALPPDHRTDTGGLFWTSPKRVPHALEFDADNEEILEAIVAAANLYAEVVGVEQVRDKEIIREIARTTATLPFAKKAVQIDTDDSKPATETHSDDSVFIDFMRNTDFARPSTPFKSLQFEKDDDLNFHIDFIHSLSNLRCLNYDLPVVDKLKTKLVAGKIIPAVTTSGACITGAVLIEIYKYLLELPCEQFRSWYFQLASNYYVTTKPSKPVKIGEDVEFSCWDKTVVEGPVTMEEFRRILNEKTGAEVSMMVYGDTVIYGFEPLRPDQLTMRVEDYVEMKTKTRIGEGKTSLRIEILCYGENGKEVKVPTVKYVLAN